MSLQDEVEAIQARVTQKKAEAVQAERSAKEELCSLRDRIRQGETTGDRIQDFAILVLGNAGFEAVQRLSNALQPLENSLKGLVGQYALMIEREHHPANRDGCVRGFGSTEETVTLGVIASENLIFETDKIGFGIPASGTARRMNDGKLKNTYEQLCLKPENAIGCHWLAKAAGVNSTEGRYDLDFFIGDGRVTEWLNRRSKFPGEVHHLDFAQMTDMIQRPMNTVPIFAEKIRKEREAHLNEISTALQQRNTLRYSVERPKKDDSNFGNVGALQLAVKHLLTLCEQAKLLGIGDDLLVKQILEEYAPSTEVASKTATAP